MMRNRKLSLYVISALILAVTSLVATTATIAQESGTVHYAYDENGRLRAVISPNGTTTVYTYDAAGNILSITRQSTPFVSISGFTPAAANFGATVTVFGSGFSTNIAEDTVTFNGTPATITSATAGQITTTVPPGASTGPITVVTPNGAATSHTPFIVRAPLEITNFNPSIGNYGTPVTVLGNGFDEAVQENRPKFNGFEAVTDSASSQQLVTSVPTSATSGHISVTTPQGTAFSSGDFFVPPPPFSVDNVDFTGRLAFGESKTIALSGVSKIALIVFDATAGQKVNITRSNMTFAFSLMYLYAPEGEQLYASLGGSIILTLPATGTYTILVSSYFGDSGSLDLTLNQVADVRTPITAGGPAVTFTLTAPGQSAILSFAGGAGQKVSLAFSNVTIPYADVTLLDPDGSFLASTFITSDPDFPGGNFIDALDLPVAGTYTIVIEPNGEIGSATAVLYNVVDVFSTVTIGGNAILVTTTTPGQNARISFDGTAGQVLNLSLSAVTYPKSYVSVYNPDGTILVPRRTIGPGGGDQETLLAHTTGSLGQGESTADIAMELPVTGTYLILIDPVGPSIGNATLTLTLVADVTATIIIGGPPVTITTYVSGQNALVTFDGTANQRVFLAFSDLTLYDSLVSITNPDGSTLVDPINLNSNGGAIDINNLPATGTYTIFVETRFESTGDMTIQAFTNGSLLIGGPTVTAAITSPGQIVSYSFEGTEGRRITVSPETNIPSGSITLFRPDGSVLVTDSLTGFSGVSLPDNGTYRLTIDPDGNSGVITFRLRSGGGGSGVD